MAPIDLNLVRAFVAVHESGSFSAAGERLGVPRSTISRAVAALEESLDVLLFHRTTRKVTTTAAGRLSMPVSIPISAAMWTKSSACPALTPPFPPQNQTKPDHPPLNTDRCPLTPYH